MSVSTIFRSTLGVLSLSTVVFAEVEFNRDIRPILSNKCFACHGPDANKREADLRLDRAESATINRGEYKVITPGDIDQSELITRILSNNPDDQMPPPEFGKPLSTSEVELIKQWITQGAAWEDHWSFAPLARPTLPGAKNALSSPIDAAILAELGKQGMGQSADANPRVLLRRLSFDLTGLPPSPEEVASFEQDHSWSAYEAKVDELLASPHFGERMAIYWLDLVRYADTLGYHGDQERSVSPYRDYVIEAFNNNMSFDQFTIENLAGDLLPDPTLSQKVASTYNRLNRASGEGGVQPKEYLAKYSADRVRTLGSVWLGTTVGCAECHDHKFDPYTAKDFYSLAAFFADVKEQGIVSGANYIEQMPVPTKKQAEQQQDLAKQISQAEAKYNGRTPELEKAYQEWHIASKESGSQWQIVKPTTVTSKSGTTLTILDDQSILASGANPEQETYTVQFDFSGNQITALRLEILADNSFPGNGPGRAGNGNLVINSVNLRQSDQKVDWEIAVATHSQGGFEANNLAKNNNGWALLPKTGESHQIVLIAKSPLPSPSAEDKQSAPLTLSIDQNHGSGHSIGKFRISIAKTVVDPKSALGSGELAQLLEIEPGKRSAEQQAKLFNIFRSTTPLLKEVRDQLATLKQQQEQLQKSIVTTLVTVSTTPREMRVLPRGDWMSDAGELVLPAFPEFLARGKDSAASKERLDRLDLAKWLVSRENPLVARTFVNRLWMLCFGQGLCRSVDDLGSQGSWPTHPELLDWLAVEFIDSGWDVKHLMKMMVMSHTYRQSSKPVPEFHTRDPYNRFYTRQSRWRLDAEMVRDNALFISGLLDTTIGGKSSRPYQPAGYWAQLNFPKRTYQASNHQDQYRRGVYTHWQRTFLHPSLLAFDAPPREECTARRDRSNTPLQALVLLNDPTYVEAARVFAENIVENNSTSGERIMWAYQKALQRNPTDHEAKVLGEMMKKQAIYYEAHPEEAKKLITTGIASINDSATIEIATWTSLARAILNLQETITRY